MSPPQRIAQTILSTSERDVGRHGAELPILALILTRKLRPIAIGSLSGWLMLDGMIARPRATSSRTNSGVIIVGDGHAKAFAVSHPRLSTTLETNGVSCLSFPFASSDVEKRFPTEIFALGDIFHFRCDNPLAAHSASG